MTKIKWVRRRFCHKLGGCGLQYRHIGESNIALPYCGLQKGKRCIEKKGGHPPCLDMRKTVEVTFMTMIPAAFADRFIENKIDMKMGKFAIIFTRVDTSEKHKAIFEFKDMVVDGNYVR